MVKYENEIASIFRQTSNFQMKDYHIEKHDIKNKIERITKEVKRLSKYQPSHTVRWKSNETKEQEADHLKNNLNEILKKHIEPINTEFS